MKFNTLFVLFSCLAFGMNAQIFSGAGADIPDDGTIIAFDIPVSGLGPAIDTTNFGIEEVCVHIYHTWSADLSVSIKAPDGTLIPLFSNVGGDQDGFTGTCLSGNVTNSIYQGSFPFTGTFRPFGDMGILNNGQNPNGTWQLVILDTYPFADTGTLYDWSITFGSQPCKAFPFFSSDLPILKITTGGQTIPNEPKITANMKVLDNGPGKRNFVHQDTFAYDGPIGIEYHGNSTQGFPKKPYDIEMRNDTGGQINVPLLHMPKGNDFVLLANFSDKTLMRNALEYQLSRDIGQYATRTRCCELILDNTYQGVYLLTEKIRRDKNRVDIAKLAAKDTVGNDLTGGYIVKIDWNGSPGWNSQFSQPASPNTYTYFQHVYPRWDEIQPAQASYIRRYVDSFEVALAGPGFQDFQNGWRRFGDEKSFIDYLFLNEISRNVDGYRLSTYFQKDKDSKGGKIRMGPVWDYDLAWYNTDYCEGFSPAGWAYNINYVCADAGVPFWWERLMQDSLFRQNLACRWHVLRSSELASNVIFGKIDSMASLQHEAQGRNFENWPILGVYVWPNPGPLPSTYDGEVIKMKDWVSQRLDWLDSTFNSYMPNINAGFTANANSAFSWTFSATAPAGYQYSWDFGDGTFSTARQPQHEYSGTGNFTVRLEISSPFGCGDASQQIIHVASTATNEPYQARLGLSPNPATGRVLVSLPQTMVYPSLIRMYSNLGQLVQEKQVNGPSGNLYLDVSGLPSAVYGISAEDAVSHYYAKLLAR
jgi:hypothetical protein